MKNLNFNAFFFTASAILLGLAIAHNNVGDYSDILFKTLLIGFSITSLPVSIKNLLKSQIATKLYTFLVVLTIIIKIAIDTLVFHNN